MARPLPPPGAEGFSYGRHSSEMQNEKSSDDQLQVNRAVAERYRWIIKKEFTDESRSGRTSRNRPGFNKMIDLALAGHAQFIIVEDISRLMRNAAEMQVCAQRLKESGVVIVTATGAVLDGLELAIRASMAQEQSEEHGRRVKRGHRATVMRGRMIGGIPYGYRVRRASDEKEAFQARKNGDGGSDLNREQDPDEAKYVIEIYEDYVAGVSTEQICQRLNRAGIPGPRGKLWRTNALTGTKKLGNGILRNPIYRGAPVGLRTVSNFVPSKGVTKVGAADKADHIEMQDETLRIVSDELWYAAQARLTEMSVEKGHPHQARRPTYTFSGKVFCGHCGNAFPILGANHGCNGRRMGVDCDNRRRVSRRDLETAVFTGMLERLLQPHILEIYLQEYRSEMAAAAAGYEARQTDLRNRLRQLQEKEENLMAQMEAGASGYTRSRLNDRLNEVGPQIELLQRQLAAPRPDGNHLVAADAIIDSMRALIADLGDASTGDDRAATTTRDLLRGMIDKVTVTSRPAIGKEDKRGSGPVTVHVKGSITRVVAYGEAGREIQHRGTTSTALDLPNVKFSFYLDFSPPRAIWEHISPEAETFRRMLRVAYGPVEKNTLIRALREGQAADDLKLMAQAHLSAEKAIKLLKARGEIRAIDLASWKSGWVLNQCGLSDDEWRERFRNPDGGEATPLWSIEEPPEAFVTVIGPDEEN